MSYTPISELILAAADAMHDAAENAVLTSPDSARTATLVAGSLPLMVGTEIAARLDHMIELMEGMRPPAKT